MDRPNVSTWMSRKTEFNATSKEERCITNVDLNTVRELGQEASHFPVASMLKIMSNL